MTIPCFYFLKLSLWAKFYADSNQMLFSVNKQYFLPYSPGGEALELAQVPVSEAMNR